MDNIKVGVGLSGWPFSKLEPGPLWTLIDRIEELGIDSIWLSDRIASTTPIPESITLLAAIAARTERLKLGTSALVMPLRNPVVLAKEIATVDFLSQGRLLLIAGVGAERTRDFEACGINRSKRGAMLDEIVTILRRLWTEPAVNHFGQFFQIEGAAIEPKPSRPGGPPIWFGGRSDAALKRTARIGDGWLASFITPTEFACALTKLATDCRDSGHVIPDDHFGVYLPYCVAESADAALSLADPTIFNRRPGLTPEAYGAFGTVRECIAKIEEYVGVGATKFILRPVASPDQLLDQIEILGREIAPYLEGESDALPTR